MAIQIRRKQEAEGPLDAANEALTVTWEQPTHEQVWAGLRRLDPVDPASESKEPWYPRLPAARVTKQTVAGLLTAILGAVAPGPESQDAPYTLSLTAAQLCLAGAALVARARTNNEQAALLMAPGADRTPLIANATEHAARELAALHDVSAIGGQLRAFGLQVPLPNAAGTR
jgi:hypothetical protein